MPSIQSLYLACLSVCFCHHRLRHHPTARLSTSHFATRRLPTLHQTDRSRQRRRYPSRRPALATDSRPSRHFPRRPRGHRLRGWSRPHGNQGPRHAQGPRRQPHGRRCAPHAGITAYTLRFYKGDTALRSLWVFDYGEWGVERPTQTSWTCGFSHALAKAIKDVLAK